jgi:pseudaminic acid cytidylyltransferase
MANLAIIPARGGSKRIPRKNIKLFLGKPIIAYSIEAALNSELFDEVMVSTDDEEIAIVAKKYGATVPFMRSKDNSDDYATTLEVINEVLFEYKERNIEYQYTTCIYPTAPFVSSALLREAFKILLDNAFDTVFPVIQYGYPIQRAIKINQQSRIQMINSEHISTRSQDLEPLYHDAGQFYLFNTDAVSKKKKLWTDNTGCIKINELQAQDIDTEIDWKLAEIKFRLLNGW